VLIESLLWSVASRVFLALVGLFSGATVLGLFTMAFRLYETLTGLVNQASQRLLFPVFAQLQEERRQLQQAFLLASRALAAVSTPLFLFVAVAAEDITRALLSEKWTAAIPAIRVLSVAGAISASAATIGPMVKVVSTPKWLIANAATAAICSIAAIAATGTADAAITALAWSSRLLGTYPLVLVQLGLVVGFSVWSFLRASALPTLRSGAIWCLVAAVLQVLPVEAGFARLAFIAVVGGSMELLALWMLDRSFVMRLIELLRSSRTRR
jgi:O-antigen/teichoic acid export membrane protein